MQKFLPLILIVAFFSGIILILDSFPQPQLTPLSTSFKTPSPILRREEKKDFTKLIDSYNQILGQTQADFAVTFLDLKTGEKVSINGEKPFHAASTTKPIVAAYALKLVDEDRFSLDQKVADMLLAERIRLLINISDNDSWEQLLNFFGIAKIQKFSQGLGLLNTDQYKNTSTTEDLVGFLAKIFQDSILSQESRQFLLNLMQKTETEDRIPEGIQNKKLVFHKAGSFEGEIHDIGIIANPENPFILAILSDGKNDIDSRPAILAEIARVSREFADNQK